MRPEIRISVTIDLTAKWCCQWASPGRGLLPHNRYRQFDPYSSSTGRARLRPSRPPWIASASTMNVARRTTVNVANAIPNAAQQSFAIPENGTDGV